MCYNYVWIEHSRNKDCKQLRCYKCLFLEEISGSITDSRSFDLQTHYHHSTLQALVVLTKAWLPSCHEIQITPPPHSQACSAVAKDCVFEVIDVREKYYGLDRKGGWVISTLILAHDVDF